VIVLFKLKDQKKFCHFFTDDFEQKQKLTQT